MDLQKIESILEGIEVDPHREAYKFNVLQHMVTALLLRSQITGQKLLDLDFYRWYIRYLYKLSESLQEEIGRMRYQLHDYKQDVETLISIWAIINSNLPPAIAELRVQLGELASHLSDEQLDVFVNEAIEQGGNG